MKTCKLYRLAVAITLVLSASAWAAGKPAALTGWVHSAAGVPQMGAAVEIMASGSLQAVRVFTDENGFYSAKNLLPGVYHVRVTAPTFLPSLRENVNLRSGAERVVNLTLDTLFDAMQTLPRRPGVSDDDDWNWTLRSCANRPILRMVNGLPEIVSRERGEERPLKGQVAFVAGASDDFNTASSGDMSTAFSVQSSVFSAGTLSFEGNVGYGSGTPGVVRATYTHRMENGSTPRIAFTMRRFATPDSVLHDGALQALSLTTSDDFTLGNALEFKAGSDLQTIQFMGRVTAARPFGSVALHLSPDTVVEYKYATSEPNTRLEKGFDSAPADSSPMRPTCSACPARPAPARMPGTTSSCTSSTTATGPAISSRSCRGSTSTCAGRRRKGRRLKPFRHCPRRRAIQRVDGRWRICWVPRFRGGRRPSQIQIPVLRDDLLAEGFLRFALRQREAAAGIDLSRRHELGMRP